MERQRFTQWWLWALLLLLFSFMLYPIIAQLATNHDGFSLWNVHWSFWISITFAMGICILFALVQLKTVINQQGIFIHYFPFFKKQFLWKEIRTAKTVSYGFIGYGIRISLHHGTAYNVKGDKGLALVMNNGKKYLIGTQESEKVTKLIEELHSAV